MPAQNAELVRKLYESFAERGVRAVMDLLDPQVTLQTPAGTPEEGTYRGHEEVIRHLGEMVEPFTDVRIAVEELIEARDQVVVVFRGSARGRGSGLEIDARFAHLITIRDGMVTRLQAFFDKDAALEALAKGNAVEDA